MEYHWGCFACLWPNWSGQAGRIYRGQVSRLLNYGAVISFETSEGKHEGWLHPSDLPTSRNGQCFVMIVGHSGTMHKLAVHLDQESVKALCDQGQGEDNKPRAPGNLRRLNILKDGIRILEAWSSSSGSKHGPLAQTLPVCKGDRLNTHPWTTVLRPTPPLSPQPQGGDCVPALVGVVKGRDAARSRLLQYRVEPGPPPTPLSCPLPDFGESSSAFELPSSLDLPSLLLGLAFGLCFGPIVDLLFLVRHGWARLVRVQARAATRGVEGGLPPAVERLLRDLRAEVRTLSLRTQALEARIALLEEFEVVVAPSSSTSRVPSRGPASASTPPLTPARPASTAAVPFPSPTSSLSEPAEVPLEAADTEGRAALAREIGAFLRRSLDGGYRGNSGRSRLRLQSRLYVALSDARGEPFPEPRVFSRVSDLRSAIFNRGNPGESTFIGFASQWEARLALREAGVTVPAELAGLAAPVPEGEPGAEVEEEEEGEPLTLRDCLLDLGELIDPHSVSVGILAPGPAAAPGATVALIPVTVSDDLCLCAVPHASWNKAIARRKLPKGCLVRAVNVEVPAQGEPPSLAHAALKVKVWIGFLDRTQESCWTAGGGESAQFPFRVSGSPGATALPFFPALLQVAQEQFGFETGQSGLGAETAEEPDPLALRVGAIEKALGSVQVGLEKLLQQRPAAPAGPAAASDLPRKPVPVDDIPAPPGLDPSTVAEARRAGVPESQLRLLGELAAKPNRMGDGRGKPITRASGPLSESEGEEAPGAGGAGLTVEDARALPPMERAVLEMSAVLQRLAKKEERPRADLEDLSSSQFDGSGAGGASRSKAAAYSKLCRLIKEEEPERIVESISRLVEEDFSGMRAGPGSSQHTATMRGWLEHRSHIPGLAGPVRWAWAVAGRADALAAGRPEEAHARSLLLLAAADQAAVDSGSCLLGAEFQLPRARASRAAAHADLGSEMDQRRRGQDQRTRGASLGCSFGTNPHLVEPGRGQCFASAFQGDTASSPSGRSCAPARNPTASSAPPGLSDVAACAGTVASAANPSLVFEVLEPSCPAASVCSGVPARNSAASSATGPFDKPLGRVSDVASPNAFGRGGTPICEGHAACTTSQPVPDPSSFGLRDRCHPSSPHSQGVVSPDPVCSGDVASSSPAADPAQFSSPSSVPGSRASTFDPANLWHDFFSCLGTSDSAFSTFWHSVRSLPRPARGPLGRVWPMPVPFPSLHRAKAKRRQPDAARKLGLNALVLALSWLSLGCPSVAPPYLGLGAVLSREQWAAVKRLSVNVSAWNSSGQVDWAAMGRCAAKVEATEGSLKELARQASSTLDFESGKPLGNETARALAPLALSVDPSRISFTGTPCFDPRPFLGPANRLCFERPLTWAAEAEPLKPVPRVKLHCKREHLRGFLELLDAGDRLELFPKDAERDRLVLDARPANAYEDPWNPWVRSLASVEQFRFLFLPESHDMLVHSEDIRDCYHCFEVGSERSLRNCLRVKLRPSDCRGLKAMKASLDNEDWLVPALRTVAMGDTAAVGMAQCSHLGVILSTGRVSLSSFMTLEGRPPRSGPVCDLVIDDFVCLDPVDRLAPSPKGPGIIRAVRTAYTTVGLPRHITKAVEGAPRAEFWGCSFDGLSGRVRPSSKRAVPLAFLVLQLVTVGRTTVDLLDSVVGGIVSCFQSRRRCLALMQRVYSDARPRDRTEVFNLTPHAQGELLAAVALLPQCDIDLRARAAPLVLATDASNEAEAGAMCAVPEEAAQEMYRHTLAKGLWNKLLSPIAAYSRSKGDLAAQDELPGIGDGYSSHPLWVELATSQPFVPFGSIARVRHKRHINIGEMRAAIRAEERLARLYQDIRYVHLQDSQVSLAAMTKGRSSSDSLNRELQRSLGVYISAGLRPGYGYLESKLNPSDDLTRSAPLRSPSRAPSAWFEGFLQGDLASLHRFLDSVGLGASVGLEPVSCEAEPLEPRHGRCSLEPRLTPSEEHWLQDPSWLWELLRAGAFAGVYVCPEAGTFSAAVRPPLRSSLHPEGVPDLKPEALAKVRLANHRSHRALDIAGVAAESGVRLLVEHPYNGCFWKLAAWSKPSLASRWRDSVLDLCCFGSPFRKATRIRAFNFDGLEHRRCQCERKHLQLRGRNPATGKSWASEAGKKPKEFLKYLVQAVRQSEPKYNRERLDVAGEAVVPGPRQIRNRQPLELAAVSLVEPATAALRARYWDLFSAWIDEAAGDGASANVLRLPLLLVSLLVQFAQYLYDAGTPLHYYRQLVAHAQREVPACRPWIRQAWEFVTRWEMLEPLQHRPPLPEPVLHAICAVAVLWGWHRWAAVTLGAFYAICRPGEFVRAFREQLLTSFDLLESGNEFFLRIPEPKTRRRGARVQHARIKAPEFVLLFLQKVFQPLPRGCPYVTMYRRRWDALLKALLIEPKHRLTPGSLRGGGAVRAFRSGEPLAEVQWRMRLRHQETLGYYLQEVTALSQECKELQPAFLLCWLSRVAAQTRWPRSEVAVAKTFSFRAFSREVKSRKGLSGRDLSDARSG
ncbi:unnamed protein product, partial [Symbiodinium sp. CCMP2592]